MAFKNFFGRTQVVGDYLMIENVRNSHRENSYIK